MSDLTTRTRAEAQRDIAVALLKIIARPAENETRLEQAMRDAAEIALARIAQIEETGTCS